jgi:acetyl esterase
MISLNPKLEFFLENVLPKSPAGYQLNLELMRTRDNSVFAGLVEPVHQITDRVIPGPESDIPIRIYTPDGEGPFPIIVYFHGGGFVFGGLESHDPVCRSIVNAAKQILVSVDYRLAPEHRFPAAPTDCFSAVNWVYEHAEELNGDHSKISVAGDSAGGNLAAVVSQMARDKRGPRITKQLLLYPVVDAYEPGKYPSYEENGRGYFLTTDFMDLSCNTYIQNEEDRMNPYAAPIHANDFSELPPALIITAEYDPLRDEGELYGEKLRAAGVEVTMKREEGFIHGFFNLFSSMNAKDDIKEVYELIGSFLIK